MDSQDQTGYALAADVGIDEEAETRDKNRRRMLIKAPERRPSIPSASVAERHCKISFISLWSTHEILYRLVTLSWLHNIGTLFLYAIQFRVLSKSTPHILATSARFTLRRSQLELAITTHKLRKKKVVLAGQLSRQCLSTQCLFMCLTPGKAKLKAAFVRLLFCAREPKRELPLSLHSNKDSLAVQCAFSTTSFQSGIYPHFLLDLPNTVSTTRTLSMLERNHQ